MVRPAYSHQPLDAPTSWEALPYGDWLKQQVGAGLNHWWPKIFGYHLLKLGALANSIPSRLCPVPHQFGLDMEQGDVFGEMTALPFQCRSVDACLATFCLEFQQDPHALLREVDRVLVSGGHLILVGFSPYSPLATGYLLPSNRRKPPWNGRLFTPARVEDWLGLLGYRVLAKECIACHSMLWSPEIFPSLQRLMADYCPSLGSVYMIVARKLESPLTPVKPAWQLKRSFIGRPIPEAVGRSGRPVAAKTDLS